MGLSDELYNTLVEENSIGAPMKWADLQIADEEGKLLGEGEEGELVVNINLRSKENALRYAN